MPDGREVCRFTPCRGFEDDTARYEAQSLGASAPSAQSAVAEVNSGRAQARFCIEDEACFVMARACELFAMDLARRGELVVQDCRSEAKGPSQAAVTAKLKERHIVAAIECTDYCDFLVDLFHDAERR